MCINAREGYLIESLEGLIFDVKGLVHPPSIVVAYVRYFPDKGGSRKRGSLTYGKVYSFSERFALLKRKFPYYIVYDSVFDESLCEVPMDDVRVFYSPVEKLRRLRRCRRLDSLERKAVDFAGRLKEKSGIPWVSLGVTGSILVNLQTDRSDLDLVVYGSRSCFRVHRTLQELLCDKSSSTRLYTTAELKSLFDFRSKDTAVSFEQFVRTETRKAMQGKFAGTDFFIRFVKGLDEVGESYGDFQYKNVGYACIRARVVDDSDSIFTPCSYGLENTVVVEGPKLGPVTVLSSFRGRFCEQARKGEEIMAQGKVERVTNRKSGRHYMRLLVGNRPTDFMVLA